jgi:hypothetical protein
MLVPTHNIEVGINLAFTLGRGDGRPRWAEQVEAGGDPLSKFLLAQGLAV